MTQRIARITAALLLATGAHAAEAPAAKPAASTGAQRYVLAPAGSLLGFTFVQEGGKTPATFDRFSGAMTYDPANLAASKLDVQVEAASVNTNYPERDDGIREADVLDVAKFPTIEYHAASFVKGAKGIEAVGKLTVRGVTRDLRIPLEIMPNAAGGKQRLQVSGETSIKRLAFGVGQGDYASTDSFGDDITINWRVQFIRQP